MTLQLNSQNNQSHLNSYTYLQFVISEVTGQIEVNFIDKASGRVIRHIPSIELVEIVRDYFSSYETNTPNPSGI